MVPNKTRFSHSYGGAVHQYAEVTGDSEATRMSYSMAVVEDEIRLRFEARQRIEDGRQLAEGKQARNIGKFHGALRRYRRDKLEIRERKHHHRRLGEFIVPGEKNVHPGNAMKLPETVGCLNQGTQALLNRFRFKGSDIPAVRRSGGHPAL